MSWNRTALVSGVFFVVVGVAFLLDRLGVWRVRGVYVWPLLLIVLGVAVLAGARRSQTERSEESGD